MKPEDIKLTDWMRMLLGDAPPEFLIEVAIRMIFIYLLLVLGMRLMGRRMEAMLTRNENIALVTLAAAGGIALLMPDRGILPPVVVVTVIVCIQHFIAWLTYKDKNKERIILDDISPLIEDGQFQLKTMKKSRITQPRLISELRSKEIVNLANVQRAYMEANGKFSILTFEEKKERKGLCILPLDDKDFRSEFKFDDKAHACARCGNVKDNVDPTTTPCEDCGETKWDKAIVTS